MQPISTPSASDYPSFRRDALLPNEPVLLPASVSSSWAGLSSAAHSFTAQAHSHSSPLAPAYSSIAASFGELPITVIDCAAPCSDDKESAGGLGRLAGSLSELLALWAAGEGRSLYLKDWHLPRLLAEKGRRICDELYTVPCEWENDWLNGYWAAERGDDFRFVYLGGGQSFTPLHRDVFASYSISTNLYGDKLWTLFPPHCAQDLLALLREAERSEEGSGSVDVRSWAEETRARFVAKGMVEVTQRVGESIFIPSGWYHQVENLTHPTFSLNHNWINAHNIKSVYDTLERDTAAARESIEDVAQLLQSERTRRGKPLDWRWERDFELCVGDLLRQNVGWDWTTFWRMTRHALGRIAQPEPHSPTAAGAEWPLCPIPPSSQPPTEFVLEQVCPLVGRFKSRLEMEWRWADGLEQVLADVEAQIDRVRAA